MNSANHKEDQTHIVILAGSVSNWYKNTWQREELLLAFNLYCKLPFGKYHSNNPDVIELADAIGRTPSAVAMKLSNSASLDPYHKQRGIIGLKNVSRADRAIWEELYNDWHGVAIESETLVAQMRNESLEELVEEDGKIEWDTRPTEAERQGKTRFGQRFFRDTVLRSYQYRCCVCGMPVPTLLIASHIIPWKQRVETRLNPYNGLCLCAMHDKAFDTGLMTVTTEYHVLVSPAMYEYLPGDSIQKYLVDYDGCLMTLPDKFYPDVSFLRYHTEEIFIAA